MAELELPFQDSAETAETRRIVLGEIERAQAAVLAARGPGGDNRFDWWGTAHWVDRPRWLALKLSDVEAHAAATSLPETEATEDLLDFYGGAGRSLRVLDAVDVLAWLVAGTLDRHAWRPAATQALNLLVVQPLVNPACAPLFWVALNAGLAPEAPDDLMELVRPMTFDMSTYPASRSAAPAVRAAQARFFATWGAELLPADWASLDDRAWAEACARLLGAAGHGIESNVLEPITRRAEAIREGLRR